MYYILFFKFVLSSAVLARTAQAHIEALTGKVCTIFKKEQKELKRGQKDRIDVNQMKMAHLYVVRLATQILPCLRSTSGPTLALAVCHWAYGFSHMCTWLILAEEDKMLGCCDGT